MSMTESEVALVLQHLEEKAAWNHRALMPAQRERLQACKERAEAMNASMRGMLVVFAGDMEVSTHHVFRICTLEHSQ